MDTSLDSNERIALTRSYLNLLRLTDSVAAPDDTLRLRGIITRAMENEVLPRDKFGFHPLIHSLATAVDLNRRISPDRNMTIATLLLPLVNTGFIDEATVAQEWGDDVARLIHGLIKVSTLYDRQAAVVDENFRRLLLTFAQDIRVIIIMIVERVVLMTAINHHPEEQLVHDVALEAAYLYAPLAHQLGLYKLKSELEDMSLKYTNRDLYSRIAKRLNETKRSRDLYISQFIEPVKAALEREGLNFDIKGRTKSIYSIWNKMKKQNIDIDHIYDLFAIRVIIDTPPEKERSECWMAYSVITNMYQPNPARLKDWLSIPKSNGYESLHITVRGPQGKWVEVQIRSRRMDEIAEKGIAAHWKYKGVKSEGDMDMWMTRVRDILETAESGPMELMRNLNMDIYNHEVYVFTPKGDLHKMPEGSTLLDFAFSIHSRLGCTCIGGKVNGKSRRLNYKLRSGDTVEISTSANQIPKHDWLSIVVTSKARNKIRQTLNEIANRSAELAKELLQRRFKNRKIDVDESIMARVIKKLGYKTGTDFYNAIASETLNVADVIAEYDRLATPEDTTSERVSAEEFKLATPSDDDRQQSNDVLVIGNNVKGMNYKLAKCCNPIYGDSVFGFVSAEGVIKIHRTDCPNAANIRMRYPYRIINTRWSGKLGQQFGATLHVLGNDDIGIVTNITSIINKETNATLRSISIDSNDGIFRGYLVVGVTSTESLNNIIKKIKTVKGVKDVQRNN